MDDKMYSFILSAKQLPDKFSLIKKLTSILFPYYLKNSPQNCLQNRPQNCPKNGTK